MSLDVSDTAGTGDDVDGAESGPARSSRLAPFIALGVAVVMIGLIVLLIGAEPDDGTVAESPLIGRPAPEATGTLDDGRFFDLSRRKGSFVVLNFFRSDCVPCIQEHPDLIEFVEQQRQLGSDGAEFYSVVNGDTPERVERFFAERGGDWPIIYSEADEFSVAFGVAAVPETWIIDPDGIVRERFVSKVTAEFLSITLQQYREAFANR
ncbi:MAG: TlpA family protein disulfide reductase [Ilumatobacter sp.]|jgi:cytochrome c biogenesis protein CcmG, thiol:disulfide interchange protein DsbE|uniref:TlpA family protein disulfide reductase n=1 Tax=Ilumatobacter sp. TaxID=1967498 RepID=UPI00391D2B5C